MSWPTSTEPEFGKFQAVNRVGSSRINKISDSDNPESDLGAARDGVFGVLYTQHNVFSSARAQGHELKELPSGQ